MKEENTTTIVVTFFNWDNGHLDALNPIKSKGKLIKKIEYECEEIGNDWMEGISIQELKEAEGDKLISLCKQLSSRGHLHVLDV